MSDLFRPEAIQARQNRWAGDAATIRPVSAWKTVAFLSLLSIGAIAFLFVGSYTKKERVSGVVMAADGVVRLRAPELSVISAVLVKDGQEVKAGDPIAELSRERFSDAGATVALVDQSLGRQRAQIEQQVREQKGAAVAGIASIRDRTARAQKDMLTVDEEIRLQGELISSAQRMVANLRPLAEEKIISELQYQQQLNQLIDQRARLETLKRTRQGLVSEVASSQSDLVALQAKAAAEVAGVERSALALDQDRLQRRTDSVTQLRAPVSGTVTSLVGAVGHRVDPATPIATIVPAGAKLQALLFVPSSAVGFIKIGQRVAVRYDAFPFEKFGQYAGTIVKVSEVDVPAAELELPIVVKEKSTLYRVRVELDRDSVDAYGAPVRLRPGLSLAADIELDRRTLIHWVFDPLFALGKRL